MSSAQPSATDTFKAECFTVSDTLLCAVGFDGALRQCNPAWEKALGCSTEELGKRPYLEWVHPEDRALTLQHLDFLAGGGSLVFTNRVRHRDGHYRQVLWQATAVPAEAGFYAVGIDMSAGEIEGKAGEYLRAEQALRENHALVSAIFDVAHVGIGLSDKNGRFVRVNPAFCAIFAAHPHELLGQPVHTLFPEEQQAEVREAYRQALGDGNLPTREWKAQRRNGEVFEAEIVTSKLVQYGKPFLVSLVTDVSQCRQALQVIRESERRLRMTVENLPVMVDAFDKDGRMVLWNQECERVTGYSAQQMLGNPKALELLYPDPDYRKEVSKAMRETLNSRPGYRRRAWNVTCKDGSQKIIVWSINTLIRIPGFDVWGIGEDITEREEALRLLQEQQEQLRQSEAYLREVIENLPVMVDAMDADGTILLWNQECERVTGYSAAEIVGQPEALASIYPDPEYRRQCQAAVKRVIDAEPGYRRGEWRIACKDGTEKLIAWSVNTRLKIPGFAVWGVGEDVTLRERALRQLQENEKRLRALVENIPMLVQAFDRDGLLVVWNRQCEKITGYKAAQMVGNPAALGLLYPDPEYRRQVLDKARQQGNAPRYETEITCRDGSRKSILWTDVSNEFPIPGWDNWTTGEDITARKQVQGGFGQNNLLLAGALDNLAAGVCATDGQQRLVYVNRAFCRLTGHGAEALLDQPLGKVVKQELGSFVLRHYFSFLAGAHDPSYTETRELVHRDGSRFQARLTAHRLPGEGGQNYVLWTVIPDA